MLVTESVNINLYNNDLIQKYLSKVLNSPVFSSAPKQKKLLTYLVQESQAGNGHKLKGYTVATEALGANIEFDSNHDSSVRVNVKRLRDHLYDYYYKYGDNDEICFHMEIGKYEVMFLKKDLNVEVPHIMNISESSDRRLGDDRRRNLNL